jgi:hypothetical protein
MYLQSFYDYYSDNYIGTVNVGRGYTGTSVMGNIENVLLNPAAFKTENSYMYCEFMVKVPIDDMNTVTEEKLANNSFLGMMGVSKKINDYLCLGISYSAVKSIEFDRISIELMQEPGNYENRFPSLNNNVLTLTAAYQFGTVSLGLNILNHFYRIKDNVIYGRYQFARNSMEEYAPRIQPGVYWKPGLFAFGASYVPATDVDFKSTVLKYNTTMPAVANMGVSLNFTNVTLALEFTDEFCSQMDDEFEDRYNGKIGIEIKDDKYSYRLGGMYRSEVWSGTFNPPSDNDSTFDNQYTLEEIYGYSIGEIGATEQMYVTGGIGWRNQYLNLDGSLMVDLAGNINTTQIHGSVGFILEPIFDVITSIRK